MDITSVTGFRAARTRDDLRLAPGEVVMAGGTWLMSEPQPDTTGFVDLMTLGWPDLETDDAGLRIGATCTIERLRQWAEAEAPAEWTALSIVPDAVNALLASFKIWKTATVGGNIARSFAAGSMVALAAGLDGIAEVWTPDGGERAQPVAELVTGNGTNTLAPGEVIRAIRLPARTLRSRARIRKIALAELGRSGAVVTGRVDEDGAAVFGITAATWAPTVLRFDALPRPVELADAVGAASGYYTDPLGSADWRRGVSLVLAERIRAQLEEAA
ncbi:FAD binding domain-containing protein [Microbacterium sp. SORGH_AS_0888]|uniref:FAD binding domain-containing protein n=1 Tax=Microbacterium sp. SORGH_AS_0888 TaxID=3041791 RepID=UPI00278030A9|nr:FAD binding domain-containing protein [Microbacterium sp. SORGH_AS_0888]MDQ1129867.1 CO/xanthine dehydrogenase FAD-binding subunit [Microbacterium sp. SORGH_AS_0888]